MFRVSKIVHYFALILGLSTSLLWADDQPAHKSANQPGVYLSSKQAVKPVAPEILPAAWKDMNARDNLDTAYANFATYDIFDTFKATKQDEAAVEKRLGADSVKNSSFKRCFNQATVDGPEKGQAVPGLFAISDSCTRYAGWRNIPPHYKPGYVACASPEKSSLNCNFFVVIFTPDPKDPKAKELPPIVDFKGTTELGEWKENIFSHGAALIKKAVNDLNDPSPQGLASQSALFANALYAKFKDKHMIFTGHSLGGAMAQNFAMGYTKYLTERHLPPPTIQLITYNSLAGSSMDTKLQKMLPLISKVFAPLTQVVETLEELHQNTQEVSFYSNITARDFVTSDDLLKSINHVLKGWNFSNSELVLPSQKTIDDVGRYGIRPRIENSLLTSAFEGHRMESVIEDMQYTYSLTRPQLVAKLKNQLATLPDAFKQYEDMHYRPGYVSTSGKDPATEKAEDETSFKKALDLLNKQINQLEGKDGAKDYRLDYWAQDNPA